MIERHHFPTTQYGQAFLYSCWSCVSRHDFCLSPEIAVMEKFHRTWRLTDACLTRHEFQHFMLCQRDFDDFDPHGIVMSIFLGPVAHQEETPGPFAHSRSTGGLHGIGIQEIQCPGSTEFTWNLASRCLRGRLSIFFAPVLKMGSNCLILNSRSGHVKR